MNTKYHQRDLLQSVCAARDWQNTSRRSPPSKKEQSRFKQSKRQQAFAVSSSTDAGKAESTSASTASTSSRPPTADTWELDFSSRPILDERGKKRWELLICSPDGSWKYSKFFPNNKINSTQLRIAIEEILGQDEAVIPRSVRFFRAQMSTIISRALTDLSIKPVPSRRCFTLFRWLEDRLESVYKKEEGFSDKTSALFTLDLGAPEKLPDNLRGERWSFVQLPLATLQDELKLVDEGTVFGDAMTMQQASAEDLPPTTSIPGVNQRWRYAAFRRSAENIEEAEAWQKAKSRCKGLHFLAVQKDEEADQCDGLWLLQDRELPSI